MNLGPCDTTNDVRLRFIRLWALLFAAALYAQDGQNVLLVVNRADKLSRHIGDYYISKRGVPLANVCKLDILEEDEEISWDTYVEDVERPIARCLAKDGLRDQVLYIVTTMGVPLKVKGEGQELSAEYCAVDSELALLYSKMQGKHFARAANGESFLSAKGRSLHARQFPDLSGHTPGGLRFRRCERHHRPVAGCP